MYVGAGTNRTALVVVYPNTPAVGSRQNPRGAYYENLIITSRVKLQGVGPGSPDGSIRGSILDGSAYAGDSPVATDWRTRLTQFGTFDVNNNFVPGWASLASLLVLLGGIQLIVIGILGEYIGMIFEIQLGRPPYVVEEQIDSEPSERTSVH